jgi:hypothetical protein
MLESRVYRGPAPVHVTDEMMQGVVSLPHGWGHRDVRRWQKVAAARAGVSVNDWTDDGDVEVVVGQSILNGIPVQLKPMVFAIADPHQALPLHSHPPSGRGAAADPAVVPKSGCGLQA